MSDMVTIEGEVIHGAKLGRRMGFPTANMEASGADIENGVYLSRVEIEGREYKAMSNVGVRPSVDGKCRLLETHIFDMAIPSRSTLYAKSETRSDSALSRSLGSNSRATLSRFARCRDTI